jgi:hypothetical protein
MKFLCFHDLYKLQDFWGKTGVSEKRVKKNIPFLKRVMIFIEKKLQLLEKLLFTVFYLKKFKLEILKLQKMSTWPLPGALTHYACCRPLLGAPMHFASLLR